MSDEIEIWHNPRCSKSRQTLEILRKRGYEPKVVLYLEKPPSRERISEVLKMLDIPARKLMRTGEDEYRTQRLADVDDEDELIKAMFHTPKLIERPVVIHDGKAAIGRPPEGVLKIL
jgi:arsenate reductase